MNNFKFYILIIITILLFISCGQNSLEIVKNENAIIFYDSGLKSKQINLDKEGIILNIQTFKNKKLDTEWIPDNSNLKEIYEHYGNGQIKVKGYLKNQKKHSLWRYYDRDGHLLIERYFSYDSPNNIWLWYDHHDYGKIDEYIVYDDKRDNGFFRRYYQSSNIKEKKNYVDYKLDGEYKLFHDNDKNSIHLKGKYLAGSKIDNWEIFDKLGVFQNFLK